jgi:GNAT superfamily N-acetyltransferase
LRRTARRQQRDGYTRLFVATTASESAEPRVVLGFYAINAHAIGTADLPAEAAPRPPRSNLIPAVFLSHLAVDQRHQGQGLGRILLVDALLQCQRVGQILGVRLLHRFYAAMGFKPLPSRPERLFLPLRAFPSFQPGG